MPCVGHRLWRNCGESREKPATKESRKKMGCGGRGFIHLAEIRSMCANDFKTVMEKGVGKEGMFVSRKKSRGLKKRVKRRTRQKTISQTCSQPTLRIKNKETDFWEKNEKKGKSKKKTT